MNVKISPSILSADFSKLGEEVKLIDAAGADYIHVDVMDGNFVPNITIGPDVVKALRPHSNKIFDVHLMIADPDSYVQQFADSGADIITIHAEATTDLDKSIELVKQTGKKVGVSIKPATPAEVLSEVIDKLDLILVMTVNPGFGGQKFMSDQLEKISTLRSMIEQSGKNIDLEVDGGINQETAKQTIAAGANVLVAGSYVFGEGKDKYQEKINSLKA